MQQRRADEDADDRAFAAAQAAAAQHRRRDAVEFVKIPVVRRRDGVGIEREEDSRNAREQSGHDVAARDDEPRVDAGKPRGLLVAPDGEQVAAINRAVQHEPHDDGDENQNDKRHRHAEQFVLREMAQRFKTCCVAKTFCVVARDEAREAAINQQAAERDDERLDFHPRD